MGKAKLKVKSLTPEIPKTCDLEIKNASHDSIGKIMIELVYKPFTYDQILSGIEDLSIVQKAPIWTPPGGGLLVVIIRKAFLFGEGDLPHTSASLLFRGQLRKTPVCY